MDTVIQINPIIEFIYSNEALIVAYACLLGNIALIIKNSQKLIQYFQRLVKTIGSLFRKKRIRRR